ncbi:hypothetical protein GCM10025868_22630 [Angustibacter aerolatus]|uniref:Branched-chain amino acid ATP-binding cassette transporter C-terminal domain-containing protein n=1 Tax=Angustibacter aerolatus TaxID=1162965 RepID=A0ABQ6JFT1_9ACTN|nr:hypothetical protein GCM10025868_22630 [Angustibacter aerolatus]
MLLVEQNVRLGLGLATHGVVMEGGRVRLTGTAAEVRDHPEIAALYLGGGTPSAPASAPAPTQPSVTTPDPFRASARSAHVSPLPGPRGAG